MRVLAFASKTVRSIVYRALHIFGIYWFAVELLRPRLRRIEYIGAVIWVMDRGKGLQ